MSSPQIHRFPPAALSAEVLSSWSALADLAAPWRDLLAGCSHGIAGPDATCSPLWAEALAETLLRDSRMRTLVVRQGADVVALIPTYDALDGGIGLGGREIRLITEAHGGRAGLLVKNDGSLADRSLDLLSEQLLDWDVLKLTVVEGHASKATIDRWVARRSLGARVLEIKESPYIALPDDCETLLAGLPKKFRWTIRKGEKDLRALGALEYRAIRDASGARELPDAIYQVERCSWKERTGTSITANPAQRDFYDALIRLAANDGSLSAHLLFLDGRPIAYCLGIISTGGVFLYLKGSFDAAYADQSAGHVIDRLTFEQLIRDGIRTVDFMGRCEPYKMRWTDRTYRRLCLAVYNRTLVGRLLRLRAALGRRAAHPVTQGTGGGTDES